MCLGYRGKCFCGFKEAVKPISGGFLSMCDFLIGLSVDLTVSCFSVSKNPRSESGVVCLAPELLRFY